MLHSENKKSQLFPKQVKEREEKTDTIHKVERRRSACDCQIGSNSLPRFLGYSYFITSDIESITSSSYLN